MKLFQPLSSGQNGHNSVEFQKKTLTVSQRYFSCKALIYSEGKYILWRLTRREILRSRSIISSSERPLFASSNLIFFFAVSTAEKDISSGRLNHWLRNCLSFIFIPIIALSNNNQIYNIKNIIKQIFPYFLAL